MLRPIINLVILIIIVLLQVSIFSVLPYFKYLNFVLLFVLFLTIKNDKHFLWMAIIAGYLLDIYSSYTFGTHILAMIVISFLSNYIYFNILTNHRFFPIVVLTGFSIAVYHFIISATIFILGFLKLLPGVSVVNRIILKNIWLEILYTTLAISALYFLFYLTRRNLRNIFLPTPK